MYQTGATPIILTSYIKYERLRDIKNQVFGGIEVGTVDIYIDLYSILYPLYAGVYTPVMDEDPEVSIAAAIINMIAHYRRFFWGDKIATRFFLCYGRNNSISSKKFVPGYNNDFYNKMKYNHQVHESVIKNLHMVETICNYIPDTAICITNFNTDVGIYHMMCKEDSGNYNILITKDLLTMQLAALYPRTIIFRPKKYNGEDISVFVSPLNNGLYKYACDKRKTNYPLSDTDNISAGLYSLFLAGTRLPERDMKSLLSIPVMLREINSVVQLPDVLNGYNTDVEKFCEKMTPKTYVTLQRGNISSRFKAIDTIYQYGIFANTPEAKMYQGCANLYDPNGIHQIDTEYFSKCHLQLEYL